MAMEMEMTELTVVATMGMVSTLCAGVFFVPLLGLTIHHFSFSK